MPPHAPSALSVPIKSCVAKSSRRRATCTAHSPVPQSPPPSSSLGVSPAAPAPAAHAPRHGRSEGRNAAGARVGCAWLSRRRRRGAEVRHAAGVARPAAHQHAGGRGRRRLPAAPGGCDVPCGALRRGVAPGGPPLRAVAAAAGAPHLRHRARLLSNLHALRRRRRVRGQRRQVCHRCVARCRAAAPDLACWLSPRARRSGAAQRAAYRHHRVPPRQPRAPRVARGAAAGGPGQLRGLPRAAGEAPVELAGAAERGPAQHAVRVQRRRASGRSAPFACSAHARLAAFGAQAAAGRGSCGDAHSRRRAGATPRARHALR